jgi:hypothetical protein
MTSRHARQIFPPVLGIACATVVFVSCVHAQQLSSSIDLQAMQVRYTNTVRTTGLGISPALQINWPQVSVNAQGTYAQFAHLWSTDGTVAASIFTPQHGIFFAELTPSFGGSAHEDGTRTGVMQADGRIYAGGSTSGAWIGVGGGSTWDGAVWRRVREGEAGLWWCPGAVSTGFAVQPNIVDDSIRYTDLSFSMQWSRAPFTLSGMAGVRAGTALPALTRTTTWASASAMLWIVPRGALLVSAGTYPVDYTQGFPGGHFALVGIRLALAKRTSPAADMREPAGGPTSEETKAAGLRGTQIVTGTDRPQLRLQATGARTVEIAADFTAWHPRPLTPTPGGWWTFPLPNAPGTYQVVIRVNGGPWLVPPTLPSVTDEFGGTAGVIIIPERP